MRLPLEPKIVRYGVSGAISTAVNLGTTWGLDQLGVHYIVVVTTAFLCSVVVSFVMQKRFTFEDRRRAGVHAQFLLFACLAAVNLAVNDGLVHLLYARLWFRNLVIVQGVASVLIAFYSYFLYRSIFRQRAARTTPERA